MALITSVTRFGKILKSLTANRFERLLGNCPHFQPTLAILSSYWGIILNIVQTVSATLPLTFFIFNFFNYFCTPATRVRIPELNHTRSQNCTLIVCRFFLNEQKEAT